MGGCDKRYIQFSISVEISRAQWVKPTVGSAKKRGCSAFCQKPVDDTVYGKRCTKPHIALYDDNLITAIAIQVNQPGLQVLENPVWW